MCYYKEEAYYYAFSYEFIYGLLITAVPLVIITVLNVCILRSLSGTDLEFNKYSSMSRKRTSLKTQFTIILLGVSVCFVCLNLPYFIIWCCAMGHIIKNMDHQTWNNPYTNELLIAKTLFCCNYCVNFFLYCFSGSYYKKELTKLFPCCKSRPPKHRRLNRKPTYTCTSTNPPEQCNTTFDVILQCAGGLDCNLSERSNSTVGSQLNKFSTLSVNLTN